jgi:hypothetical protein
MLLKRCRNAILCWCLNKLCVFFVFFWQGLEGKKTFCEWSRFCKNCLYVCILSVILCFFLCFLYVVAKLSAKKSTAFNLERFWTCLNSFTNALLFFEYNPGVFDRGWGRDRLQTGQKQFPIWFARPVRLPQKNRSFLAVRHTVRNEAAPTHPADRLNAVEQEMDQREPLVKSCIGYLAT